jgi:PPE-repeat protein
MPGADWGLMPPEVIAGQIMTGDGGASIAAAAAAYESLVAMLTSEGAAMGATTAGTAAGGWEGLGGTAMVATAMPYVAALEGLSAWIQQSAAAATGILEAYNTTRASLIPVPACELNRAQFAAAVAAGIFGWPAAVALQAQYQEYWIQNASLAGSYEGVVTGILATLATPAPPAPSTANPAGPAAQAAAVGEAAANGAVNASMHAGLQGVNEATAGTQAGAHAAAAPAEASQLVSQVPQMLGQIPQMMGQLPQMLGQFPQMMSQFPQMAMGMLGPLANGMNANTAGLGALEQTSAELAPVATNAGLTGSSAASSGLSGSSAVLSSFTRPTSSFNAPGPPKLPTGWTATQAAPAPEVATSAQPAMTGGTGGLYGAPGMMRDDRSSENAKPVRTMQLTTVPAPGRGE